MRNLSFAPFYSVFLSSPERQSAQGLLLRLLLGLSFAIIATHSIHAKSLGSAVLSGGSAGPSESGLLSRLTQANEPATGADLNGSSPVQAILGPVKADEVEASLVFSTRKLLPGQPFEIGLRLQHAPLWHTYWVNPGDSGLPTDYELHLLDASGQRLPVPLEPIQWPAPYRLPVGPLASYGFEGDLLLARLAKIPEELVSAPSQQPRFKPIALEVQAHWLVCKDVCIPGDARFVIPLRQVSLSGRRPPALEQADPLGLQLDASAGSVAPEIFGRVKAALPVLAPKPLGYSISTDGQRLIVFGDDPAQAMEGGYLFIELEGLVQPAAAQALYQSSKQGFWLEVPLGGSSTRLTQNLKSAPTPLYAVFRPQDPASGPVRWSLLPARMGALEVLPAGTTVYSGPIPNQASLVNAGKTAEQAYQVKKTGADAQSFSGLGLGLAFVLALLGGLLLNLMPCVFPVLGLKLLALSQHAQSRAHTRRHALVFTAGVLVSMLALASVLLGLRAAGEAIGWGFQLQNPWVVLGLALLFVAIALNFFGLYEFGLGLARVGAQAEQNLKTSSDSGAFGSGVLAVVLASPCTAPFMGSALGFAVSAPHWGSGLLVFLGLGLGLALPFMLLAVVPGATRLLPKPGAWMQTFRELLGFPMLATAAWLVWVLIQQQGTDAGLRALMALVLLAFILWLYGRRQTAALQSKAITGASRWLSHLAMISSVSFLIYLVYSVAQTGPSATALGSLGSGNLNSSSSQTNPGSALAEQPPALSDMPWRAGLAQDLASQGKVVFVDFTAAWCISCQANKARVLNRGEVSQRLSSEGYQLLTADWTRQDSEITAELARHGRSGVPLYLVYGPALKNPLILGEWLTEADVLKAFEQARAGR
ncbi:MAG: thioredoxin family protein [Bordetella sp.]